MKPIFSTIGVALAVVLLLLAGAIAPASAQGQCLGNRDIQKGVASGDFAPLSSALASAGVSGSEEVLSVKVCQQNGSWVYVVSVLDRDGYARNLVLPAGK